MGCKRTVKRKGRPRIPGLAARLRTAPGAVTVAAAVPLVAISGLPARLPLGVLLPLPGLVNFSLIRLRLPSLISAPEPAPSLSEPAPVRGRLFSGREGRLAKFSCLTLMRMVEDLRPMSG